MPAANKSQAKSSSAAVGPKSASASQTPSACLQALVEERMTSLIRDAASIQRHAKRARLHPVPGGGAVVKRRLHASDVNMALRLRDSEPLYGTGVSVTSNADDVILELADYVRQPVVTQPPSEVAASMHWLAVQGQVPDIPQNVSTGSTGTATSSSPTKVSTSATTAAAAKKNNPLQVQQLQMAVLSEELQLYYAHVTLALESNKQSQLHTVLQSLTTDRGLQELVPFWMHYSETTLLKQSEHSVPVIQMILALLQNPHVHLELHFDKVIKPLMTCIVVTVRKNIPASLKSANHWAIRQWASLAVVTACKLFHEYSNFRSGVLQVLCRALEPSKSLPTRYGALVALRQFGPKVVDAIGLQVILDYWPEWQEAFLTESDPDRAESLSMCLQASLEASTVYFQGISISEQMNRTPHIDWYDVLGDAVTPMAVMAEENHFAYATCFV